MLMGLELSLIVSEFLKENRIVRGAAHPILFAPGIGGDLPEPSFNDDVLIFGGLPARKKSFIKALANGDSVLLYPGGAREALHRKVCWKIVFSFHYFLFFHLNFYTFGISNFNICVES